MVQLSFLTESSLLALSSIIVGTKLGLCRRAQVRDRIQSVPYPQQPRVRPTGIAILIIFGAKYSIAPSSALPHCDSHVNRSQTRPYR